jgi:hypothetical protein
MKIIATPDSLRIVNVPLKATPKQFPMVEAAMQLALEVPVKIVGDTMIVQDNRQYAKAQNYDNA